MIFFWPIAILLRTEQQKVNNCKVFGFFQLVGLLVVIEMEISMVHVFFVYHFSVCMHNWSWSFPQNHFNKLELSSFVIVLLQRYVYITFLWYKYIRLCFDQVQKHSGFAYGYDLVLHESACFFSCLKHHHSISLAVSYVHVNNSFDLRSIVS